MRDDVRRRAGTVFIETPVRAARDQGLAGISCYLEIVVGCIARRCHVKLPHTLFMPRLVVLLAVGNGYIRRNQNVGQTEPHPLVIPDREGMDLSFGHIPAAWNDGLARIVQHKLRQRLPCRRMVD